MFLRGALGEGKGVLSWLYVGGKGEVNIQQYVEEREMKVLNLDFPT